MHLHRDVSGGESRQEEAPSGLTFGSRILIRLDFLENTTINLSLCLVLIFDECLAAFLGVGFQLTEIYSPDIDYLELPDTSCAK